MSISFLSRCGLLLLAWLGSAAPAQASHVLAVDLTYVYVRDYDYLVTARIYSDYASSATPGTQVPLTCTSTPCGSAAPIGFSANLVRTSLQTVPASCSRLNYSVTVLQGTVQLRPGQWTLSIDGLNRVQNLVNVNQSASQTCYVQATLDNTTYGLRANSSPQFNNSPLIQLLGPRAQRYSASAFDVDGDSLTCKLFCWPTTAPSARSPCAG